jgi:NADH:ubiquinone oxidoreductase subunit 4 (subunit M)
MLLYTIFFRFPFIGVLLYTYFGLSTLNLTFLSPYPLPLLFSCLIFISFAVKLPVYGLHYWLPLAHVEAPTFGSILLAGILLKLGGCGIYRFFYFIPSQYSSLLRVLIWVVLIGAIISSLVCCIQSDIKRLIAYSSVVHITSVALVLLFSITISYKRALIIIIMHGISSPLLFFTVGELYDKLGTRSILLIRGLYLFSPVLF